MKSAGCWGLWFLLLIAMLSAQLCQAHARTETYSRMYINGNTIDITYTMPINQLVQKLPRMLGANGSLDREFGAEILTNFQLFNGTEPCPMSRPVTASRSQTVISTSWQVNCPDGPQLMLRNHAFFDYLPDQLHISRVTTTDRAMIEKVFTDADHDWVIRQVGVSAPAVSGSTFTQYLGIGIEHITSGYDHLAFLLAIILVCSELKLIIWSVTGFTLGHSLTLCAAVLGYTSVSARAIEALIGWTIALVAAEIIAERYALRGSLLAGLGVLAACLLGFSWLNPDISQQLNPLILTGIVIFSLSYLGLSQRSDINPLYIKPSLTLLFGLIHGFGFAGSLLQVGLPTERLVAALVGFNLGVEIGQLALITLFIVIALIMTRLTRLAHHWLVIDGTAAALSGLGLFWFVSRGFSQASSF